MRALFMNFREIGATLVKKKLNVPKFYEHCVVINFHWFNGKKKLSKR